MIKKPINYESEYDPLVPNNYKRCWRMFKKTVKRPLDVKKLIKNKIKSEYKVRKVK